MRGDGAEQELRDVLGQLPLAQLSEVWDASPALMSITVGPQHRVVYQNRTAQLLFGAVEFGVPLREAFSDVGEVGIRRYDRAYAGEVVEVAPRRVDARDIMGGEVLLRYVVAPARNASGEIVGTVLTGIDVTAEVHAEQAAARARLLNDISARVGAARSAAGALQALVDSLVPKMADLAAVYVLPDSAPVNLREPVPPAVLTLGPALDAVGPPPPPVQLDAPSPWMSTLQAGAGLVFEVTHDTIEQLARDEASRKWLHDAHARSLAVAPLLVGGGLTGALVLLTCETRESLRETDLPFLYEVTVRAGAAITQLQTQRRQRDVAEQLQRALLPEVPRRVAGVQVAVRYVAGAADVEVGGDWWEVTELPDGCIGLGIGDVSGRGVSAAAVMGQARVAMRAAGLAGLSPIAVLELLDGQLSDASIPDKIGAPAPPRFATASYGVLDPDHRRIRLSNAGHLPLLVRGIDGSVRTVELPTATPLGLRVGGFEEVVLELAPGETIALFTDGLVESREQDLDDGLHALAQSLEAVGGQEDLEEVADALLRLMGRAHGLGEDDVALLLIRIESATDSSPR